MQRCGCYAGTASARCGCYAGTTSLHATDAMLVPRLHVRDVPWRKNLGHLKLSLSCASWPKFCEDATSLLAFCREEKRAFLQTSTKETQVVDMVWLRHINYQNVINYREIWVHGEIWAVNRVVRVQYSDLNQYFKKIYILYIYNIYRYSFVYIQTQSFTKIL